MVTCHLIKMVFAKFLLYVLSNLSAEILPSAVSLEYSNVVDFFFFFGLSYKSDIVLSSVIEKVESKKLKK